MASFFGLFRVTAFENSYVYRLRKWARHSGLIKLFGLLGRAKYWWREKKFRKLRGAEEVGIDVLSIKARMAVSNRAEYFRIESIYDDRHLVAAMAASLGKGDCCWDIGANIGVYTVLFSKIVGEEGQVVCFEPEEKSFERLSGNIHRNKLKNVIPLKMALGSRDEEGVLQREGPFASGAHHLAGKGSQQNDPSAQPCLVRKGDSVFRERSLRVPKAIKIDVEGFELDVLTGSDNVLRDPHCRTVLCEVHFSLLEARGLPDAPREIVRYLQERSFHKKLWLDPSHLLACKP